MPNLFGRELGPHDGMGPKGFKRSDERIRDGVAEAIAYRSVVDELRLVRGEGR